MARILVCEDDAVYRELAGGILTARGHDVVFAEDGDQALERLIDGQYDLVVTDLVMPGADGLEVIRSIREKQGSVPVLAMSGGLGSLKDPLLLAASVMGASKVMEKPFRGRDFGAEVDALLAS
jgi:two-component system cell cycle response regulator CpdR